MRLPDSFLFAIARNLAGHTLNGELAGIPSRHRGIANHLNGLSSGEARMAAWQGYLAGQEDPDSIVRALSAIDPSSPVPDSTAESSPGYRLTRTSDVVCRPVEWLWGDRVPRGMLTLFAGDPKLGKSFVTVATAAAVSRRVALPGDGPPGEPGSVVLMSAEDDLARTIVPRLKAAGADLTRIHILESVFLKDGSEALPSLRVDSEAIEQAVASLGNCKLVVIDPVSAYLGGTDDHKNGELRGVLSPLKAIAERTDAAIILVTHLNKSSGTNGKHRVTGSIAYVGACRANFLFARDRDDPTGRRVLMLANGCNLAGDVPTLAYRIEDRGDGPAVEWEDGPVDITVEQALEPEVADPGRRAEARECETWLRERLSKGDVEQPEVESDGRRADFSKDQLRRAKERIGATSVRVGFGPGSKCLWRLSLPGSTPPDDGPATIPIDGSSPPIGGIDGGPPGGETDATYATYGPEMPPMEGGEPHHFGDEESPE